MEDDRLKAKGALPFVILVGAAALFFRGALFTGQTFYFRDITNHFYPTRRLIGELVREGYFPLWHPFVMSGVPLAADVVNNFFYPLSVIYYLLPFDLGFKWFIIGHYPIAGISWYLLGREWGLPRGAALFGGIAFMLSGPLLSLTNVINFLPGIVWLPLTLLGFHRTILRHSWRAAAWASVVLALQALGDPQMVYFTVIVMGLYGLAMLRPPWTKFILTTFGALGGIGILAALLAAVQLIPLAELYRESVRAAGFSYAEATSWPLRLYRLLELLFPRLFGDPALWTYWIGVTRGGDFAPWLLSPYLGIPTLALAMLGLLVRWRERLVWFLIALLGLSGILALGDATPVHRLAFRFLPLYAAFRYPEKWWLLAAFALAGLAGIGMAALFAPKDTARRRLSVAILCVVLSVGILMGIFIVSIRLDLVRGLLAPVFRADDLSVMIPFIIRRATWQGALSAGLLLTSALCLVLLGRSRTSKRGIEVCLLLLLVVDLAVNQSHLAPVTPSVLHRALSPIAGMFLQETAPFRVLSIHEDWLQPAGVVVKDRPAGVGYYRWLVESLYPDTGLRYRLYEQGGGGSTRLRDYETLWERFVKTRYLRDYWSLWNVKYVISLRESNMPLLELLPVPSLDPPIRVYRNRDVLPRAWVVPQARRFKDREHILSLMTGAGFDARKEVLLEGEPDDVGSAELGAWRAEIVRHSPNEIVIEASSDAGGYLVLAETFYPGWQATVDGTPRQLLRANYAMRAVWLEPGAHRVHFVYRPWSVWLGAAISLGTLLGLFVLLTVRRSDTFWQSP